MIKIQMVLFQLLYIHDLVLLNHLIQLHHELRNLKQEVLIYDLKVLKNFQEDYLIIHWLLLVLLFQILLP